jgi:predicted ribosome quality control (RQC) complex YloA/Tae2 family protein
MQEENFDFSISSNVNALSIEIPYADENYVNGRVKRLLKGWGKHKESKGEHSALAVEMKDMGKIPFSVYVRVVVLKNNNTSVYFGFDLGGAFLSKRDHNEKFKIIEKQVSAFASEVVKDWVSDELKKEEKILNQIEKEQRDLEKRKGHLEKEIQDFEKKIERNKNEIKENINLQGEKKEAIQLQDQKVKKIDKKLKDLN